MEVDYTRLKQIIITDRPWPYKPDRVTLNKLGATFPDIQIIGFGPYGPPEQGYWCLMAFSKDFAVNTPFTQGAIPIGELLKLKTTK